MAIGTRYQQKGFTSGPSAGKSSHAAGDPRGSAVGVARNLSKGSVNRRKVSKAAAKAGRGGLSSGL